MPMSITRIHNSVYTDAAAWPSRHAVGVAPTFLGPRAHSGFVNAWLLLKERVLTMVTDALQGAGGHSAVEVLLTGAWS